MVIGILSQTSLPARILGVKIRYKAKQGEKFSFESKLHSEARVSLSDGGEPILIDKTDLDLATQIDVVEASMLTPMLKIAKSYRRFAMTWGSESKTAEIGADELTAANQQWQLSPLGNYNLVEIERWQSVEFTRAKAMVRDFVNKKEFFEQPSEDARAQALDRYIGKLTDWIDQDQKDYLRKMADPYVKFPPIKADPLIDPIRSMDAAAQSFLDTGAFLKFPDERKKTGDKWQQDINWSLRSWLFSVKISEKATITLKDLDSENGNAVAVLTWSSPVQTSEWAPIPPVTLIAANAPASGEVAFEARVRLSDGFLQSLKGTYSFAMPASGLSRKQLATLVSPDLEWANLDRIQLTGTFENRRR